MSILKWLCGPKHLVVQDVCYLLFWVFAFAVPCLNIASSERPSESKVTSPISPPPTINLHYLGFISFIALTNLWDDLLFLFAYCTFLHLTGKLHESSDVVFCFDYLWMFKLAQSMWSFRSRWMNQSMNQWIKIAER